MLPPSTVKKKMPILHRKKKNTIYQHILDRLCRKKFMHISVGAKLISKKVKQSHYRPEVAQRVPGS